MVLSLSDRPSVGNEAPLSPALTGATGPNPLDTDAIAKWSGYLSDLTQFD